MADCRKLNLRLLPLNWATQTSALRGPKVVTSLSMGQSFLLTRHRGVAVSTKQTNGERSLPASDETCL